MERDDATQEGINLSPQNTVRLIAEAAARQVIIEHITLCPLAKEAISERLRKLEMRFSTLVGFMLGSGLLGGTTGALLTRFLH